MMQEESTHWEHSERLTQYAGSIYSRHVRVVVIAAELRRIATELRLVRPTLWDRFLTALHRFVG
jgi:hypothetical protein